MRSYAEKMLIILGVITILFLGGCGSDITDELTSNKSFKSDSTVTLYRLNSHNQKALMITGKPFMIVKYMKIVDKPATDCYFGLSDVVESDVPGVASIPHDSFPAGSAILLAVDWDHKKITDNGDAKFSFEYYPSGHFDERIEKWEFVFENESIRNALFVSGSVRNIDSDNFTGIDSDSKTFRLDAQ